MTTTQTLANATRVYLYETENYGVCIEDGAYKKTPWAGHLCYRIYNKNTFVVEGEGCVYSWAIRSCHMAENFLAEVIADPDGRKEPVLPEDPLTLH